jgi:hypothetical protein
MWHFGQPSSPLGIFGDNLATPLPSPKVSRIIWIAPKLKMFHCEFTFSSPIQQTEYKNISRVSHQWHDIKQLEHPTKERNWNFLPVIIYFSKLLNVITLRPKDYPNDNTICWNTWTKEGFSGLCKSNQSGKINSDHIKRLCYTIFKKLHPFTNLGVKQSWQCNFYGCAVSRRDVDSSTITSFVTHSMLIAIIK